MTLARPTGPLSKPFPPLERLRDYAADWRWCGPMLPIVYDLAVIPPTAGVASATTYYAACGAVGVYRDNGDNPTAAQRIYKGLPQDARALRIVRDPNDPQGLTLFVSVDWLDTSGHPKAGVFKTTNLDTWEPLGVPTVSGLPPTMVQSVIYAFAFVSPARQANTLYAGGYVGVVKTTDGGLTWTVMNEGLPSKIAYVTAIAVDPYHSQTLYCAVRAYDASGKDISDVYKRGSSGPWQATGLGRLALSLTVDAKGSAVYAGTEDGVFKCEQYGAKAWVRLVEAYSGADVPRGSVAALLADPTDYAGLFAGTHEGSVLWSTDGGLSWILLNSEPTNFQVCAHLPVTQIHTLGLAIRPGPSAGSLASKTLFAGIEGGILRIDL